MLDQLKALQEGRLEDVSNSMLYPLLRWISADVNNLFHCELVNQYLFSVPQDMSKSLLYYGLKPLPSFLKYPKARIEEDERIKVIKPYIKRYFGWGDREFKVNLPFIVENLQEVINWVVRYGGLENDELEVLGIKKEKIKVKVEKQKAISKWW